MLENNYSFQVGIVPSDLSAHTRHCLCINRTHLPSLGNPFYIANDFSNSILIAPGWIFGNAQLYFPMQKVEKIRFMMSSGVVWPVSVSNAHSAR